MIQGAFAACSSCKDEPQRNHRRDSSATLAAIRQFFRSQFIGGMANTSMQRLLSNASVLPSRFYCRISGIAAV